MRESSKIAIGGLTTAASLVLMFMTGIIPFSTFMMPAVAGALLTVLVIEIGFNTALIAYGAVSLLSFIIAPDKEAAMIFAVFFGYYPIIKEKLEKIKKPLWEYIVKFGIFNFSVVTAYYISVQIIGVEQVLEDMGVNVFTIGTLIILGNITFLLYDRALSNIITIYIYRIRKKLKKNFKKY